MFYYKEKGNLIAVNHPIDAEEITKEEYIALKSSIKIPVWTEEMQKRHEMTRPLTAEEVNRLYIAQNIQTIITDDATASRAVEFHPEMQYNGKLIPAKTRINWKGKLKRAAVDLWDTEANNPDNAPNLWEDIAYRDGFRIIPEVITATLAFSEGEHGWWKDKLYKSKVKGNCYNPDVYPGNWEEMIA